MHNGFVQIDGEKMSKSLGNSFFLKDALKLYDGEVLRYYLNAVHYRNDFNFSEEELQLSKKRLDKLYRLKKRVNMAKGSSVNKDFKKDLLFAMSDDLNISVALSIIDERIATTNDALDANPKDKGLKKETISNIEFIDSLLGFGAKEPFSYFQIGVSEVEKAQIEPLISSRTKAKKEKDFSRSDALRDELTVLGIAIMDTPEGTLWEKA
jgi:cysteinyl-tRNA synthetase